MNFSRASDRLLIALDFDNAETPLRLARSLAGRVGGFKVGLELVNAAGTDIFERLRDAGAERIFYDAKFHDIPNTVAGAVRAAARRGVWMVNVHASGGAAMLRAAAEAAREGSGQAGRSQPPLVIGVTVLTSIAQDVLNNDLRVGGTVEEQAVHLATLCREAGLDGVVASAHEAPAIKRACGQDFLTVIPGVRPAGAATHDQARVATPAEAVRLGADYLVIGRAVTRADDPAAAVAAIAEEI